MGVVSKNFINSTEAGVRQAVTVGDGYLLAATPVDTGLHRGSWIVSIARPSNRIIKTPARISTSRGLQSVLSRWSIGKGSIFFTNNGPAIVQLDEGSSRQAPSGMSQGAIAIMQTILRAHKYLGG
jgi:hypothetical protein